MTEYVILAALMAAVILFSAWREFAADNRRDASLLAGIGTSGLIGAAVLSAL